MPAPTLGDLVLQLSVATAEYKANNDGSMGNLFSTSPASPAAATFALAYIRPVQTMADLIDQIFAEYGTDIVKMPIDDAQKTDLTVSVATFGSALVIGGYISLSARNYSRPARQLTELIVPSKMIKALKAIADSDGSPYN